MSAPNRASVARSLPRDGAGWRKPWRGTLNPSSVSAAHAAHVVMVVGVVVVPFVAVTVVDDAVDVLELVLVDEEEVV